MNKTQAVMIQKAQANSTNEKANSLDDLNWFEWHIVGSRPIDERVHWTYMGKLPKQEKAMVHLRDKGVLLFTHRRGTTHWTLLAKVSLHFKDTWAILVARELNKLKIAEEKERRAVMRAEKTKEKPRASA